MKCPVIPLERALYGLVRSNFDWNDHCDSKLLGAGWRRCWSGEKFIYDKTFCGSRVKLVVYVDDFVAGGKDDARAAAWVELRELFDMGEPEPIRKFLGIDIISKTDGAKRLLTFSQEAFARSILEEYKQDLGIETTKKFRHVTTPGLDAFPDIESPFSSGRYASKAARYVGKLMYLARGSRPDIAQAVGRLSRFVSKWWRVHDALLHRLMQYLEGTADYALHYVLDERDLDCFSLVTYLDADHAGDVFDTRSTSGAAQFIRGPNGSSALIDWMSRKQQATAWSTGEAELVAMGEGMRPALRNQLICEGVAGRDIEHEARDDASATIGAVRKGYSPMDYVEKTQRVLLGALHDLFEQKGMSLTKEPTATNAADVMTKALPREAHERHALSLGVGVSPRRRV